MLSGGAYGVQRGVSAPFSSAGSSAVAVVEGSATTLLERLGVDPTTVRDGDLVVRTPITGEEIAWVTRTDKAATDCPSRSLHRFIQKENTIRCVGRSPYTLRIG